MTKHGEHPPVVEEAVRWVMKLLVRGSYLDLVRSSSGSRMTDGEIRGAVVDYGKQLVDPPDDLQAYVDVVRVQGACPSRWSVNIPVWTAEEGRSDLTLSVTIIETDQAPGFTVEIDDLHVL